MMFLEAGIKKSNLDGNVDHTSLVQILDLPYEPPKEQFMLLSSVSNFHKFGYPAMSELSSKSIISPNTLHMQNMYSMIHFQKRTWRATT